MEPFTCSLPKVFFGCGELQHIGNYVKDFGQKAFLAIDPYLEQSGLGKTTVSLLQDAAIKTILYSEIDPDPDCFGVDNAAKIAGSEGCDLVIAVGGGSTIDFGKGVAVMATNPGTCWEYTRRKDHAPKEPSASTLPVIAVPTTAGTGSEITHYAVFSNSKIKEKSTIVSERIVPRLALVDPELTYTCPPQLTALSGVDVLAHSIEASINIHASPWVRLVALEAIRLVSAYLPAVVQNGANADARQKMAWASTLGGMAIAHANPTLPHALGQAAGGYIHAPHGGSVAACLSQIMRISHASDPQRFAEIALAMDEGTAKLPLDVQAEQAAVLVDKLFDQIQVKVRFGDFGMRAEDIDRITEIAMTGYFTGISCHPKQVTAAEIKQIYRDCL
ncbi:MAG: iron-containing alcohol dehydrogenase [Desulfobacterales bacterium]|jgi:alcohol dehydrogenase class IV